MKVFAGLAGICAVLLTSPLAARVDGPIVTFFGITRADDGILEPISEGGIPTFQVPTSTGFRIVVEGRPGPSGAAVGSTALNYDPADPTIRPDLQIITSRPLGPGGLGGCHKDPPDADGVQAVTDFSSSQAVSDALNNFGCRFVDGAGRSLGRTPDDACLDDQMTGISHFVIPTSTIEFCTEPLPPVLAFEPGVTILSVRLRDVSGAVGPVTQIGVQVVGDPTPTPTPMLSDADSLYIGDDSDYSVKRFDAETGAFLGSFVGPGSGGVNGLRGLLFEHPAASGCGDLLLVNQNVNFNLNGEVLQYAGASGAFIKALVPATDPHGPYAPRGIALWNDSVLFIADQGNPPELGKLLAYSKDGTFLTDLTPARPEFYPRAVVIGPDGKLYVTVRNFEFCGGSVLRFDPMTRKCLDVFITNPVDCNQNVNDLHRPEGLVFGPDGDLYIASRFKDGTDTDKIVIFQGPGGAQPGAYLGNIPLDDYHFAERSAQTLLFGPHGRLFVPISDININGDEITTVPGPDTGSVRRYDVSAKTFDVFVPPSAQRGPLRSPWYLTFGRTDPATLAYDEQHDSCGGAAPVVTATFTPTPQVPTSTPTATLPAGVCVGDCGGTQTVAVNNIITLVNIALGTAPPSACLQGIPSGGQVDVTMIVRAVNNALNGCPAPPTPSSPPTPQPLITALLMPCSRDNCGGYPQNVATLGLKMGRVVVEQSGLVRIELDELTILSTGRIAANKDLQIVYASLPTSVFLGSLAGTITTDASGNFNGPIDGGGGVPFALPSGTTASTQFTVNNPGVRSEFISDFTGPLTLGTTATVSPLPTATPTPTSTSKTSSRTPTRTPTSHPCAVRCPDGTCCPPNNSCGPFPGVCLP
jgi:hypothetical protein